MRTLIPHIQRWISASQSCQVKQGGVSLSWHQSTLRALMESEASREEGVVMKSPWDETSETVLTPEESMRIQHSIGADIMM